MTERSRKPEDAQSPGGAPSPETPSARRESNATMVSAFFAGLSVLAAGASIIIGNHSAQLARQQNDNTQRQELVTLVTDIAQGQQGSSSANGNSVSAQLTQLGEAEEANNIINGLPPADVSSVERYIVGTGLQGGEDYQPALMVLKKAAQEASDPRTAADAWRGAAAISYKLGLTSQAENDTNLARTSFYRPGVLEFNKNENVAYTDLFDVYFQIYYKAPMDCSAAVNECDTAAGLIKKDKNLLSGSNSNITEKNARSALAKKNTCHMPLSTLDKEIPLQANPPQASSAG